MGSPGLEFELLRGEISASFLSCLALLCQRRRREEIYSHPGFQHALAFIHVLCCTAIIVQTDTLLAQRLDTHLSWNVEHSLGFSIQLTRNFGLIECEDQAKKPTDTAPVAQEAVS